MQWEQVKDWLSAARSIAVLTGAGISAESGIPTFRGEGGLWRNFRAEDLATPQAFARDPLLVWEWYAWRRELIARAEPNPGHLALAALEPRIPEFHLITQNVDGLHDRAGSRAILKIHGDLWDLRCTRCQRQWTDRSVPLVELPPRCECGSIARPGVVWFGEGLPPCVWEQARRAASGCQLLLVVGTSAVVYPAAGLAPLAKSAGAKVVEVNVGDTPLSDLADVTLRGPASEILPVVCG
ncbi:MAG: NAD-dependent deacylase [Bryobacterales bacterium]|nr:NAD-dependent deacylase [Bryobacterales bacterium]